MNNSTFPIVGLSSALVMPCAVALGGGTCTGSGGVPFAPMLEPQMSSGDGGSFGDFDADGDLDIFIANPMELFRNDGGGVWTFFDLSSLLPPAVPNRRYGASFGDFDNDGWPDLAIETRAGTENCIAILRNRNGSGAFENILPAHDDPPGSNPYLAMAYCAAMVETICWADLNDDGRLDCFLPSYGSDGPFNNLLLYNKGPTFPYYFVETSGPTLSNVDSPLGTWGTPHPEGAQCVDFDSDGDVDIFCNAIIYRNISSSGSMPLFEPMKKEASGVMSGPEEGMISFDYDLDGDFDYLILRLGSPPIGNEIWRNDGDGTFTPANDMDCPEGGNNDGMGAEDWDNDGDIDLTTTAVFRRNVTIDTGVPNFDVAVGVSGGGQFPTPCYGDVDADGDLDMLMCHYLGPNKLFRNTLYDSASIPLSQRRYICVRALRDSTTFSAGLETEYGTNVTVHIAQDALLADGRQPTRKKVVASSAGYVNQSQYTLHFGMPADNNPDPNEDRRFDITADFPTTASSGMWRVDKHVNVALGNIDLADLTDRQIRVFRSGKTIVNGVTRLPSSCESQRLTTAGGGLVAVNANAGASLQPPTGAPSCSHAEYFVGIDFDTLGEKNRVRLRELILDGTPAGPVTCGLVTGKVLVWDTTSATPTLVSLSDAQTSALNHRHYIRLDVTLDTNRTYRLVVPVSTLRATTISGPIVHDDLRVNGGLAFCNSDPCDGTIVASAPLQSTNLYLTFRYGPIKACSADCAPLATNGGLGGNGVVNQDDLNAVTTAWGQPGGPCDVAPPCGNGVVDTDDLLAVINAWGACP